MDIKLKSFLFLDRFDETETEVVCENFDTALSLFCHNFDILFIVEKVEEGCVNKYGFPTVHITGMSYTNKG